MKYSIAVSLFVYYSLLSALSLSKSCLCIDDPIISDLTAKEDELSIGDFSSLLPAWMMICDVLPRHLTFSLSLLHFDFPSYPVLLLIED